MIADKSQALNDDAFYVLSWHSIACMVFGVLAFLVLNSLGISLLFFVAALIYALFGVYYFIKIGGERR